MKKLLISAVACLSLAGCGEAEFAGGFASGVAAMTQMSGGWQDDFIVAGNALVADTAKMNEMRENLVVPTLKPETVATIEKVKGLRNDPMAWAAIASWILNGGAVGAVVANRKKKKSP